MHRPSPQKRNRSVSWTPKRHIMTQNIKTGRAGENLVIFYLKQRGWRIECRNYETARGEIDIIASRMHADLRGYPTVAFIEVKSRTGTKGVAPELSVTRAKQNRMTATVRQWIGSHPELRAVYRCDIATIVLDPKKAPRIRYFPCAFHIREAFGW